MASDFAVHRRLSRVQRLLDEEMKKREREEKEKGQNTGAADKGAEDPNAPKPKLRSWAAKSPFRYSVEDSKKVLSFSLSPPLSLFVFVSSLPHHYLLNEAFLLFFFLLTNADHRSAIQEVTHLPRG